MIYHTNTTGPSAEGFIRAFGRAMQLAKADGTNQVLVSVHTLANLEGIIADTLGEQFVKRFKKNHMIQMEDVAVHLETERIRSRFRHGVALAPFVSTRLLIEIIEDPRVTAVIYIPWSPEELSTFKQSYQDSVQI